MEQNQNRKSILLNALRATGGLMLFGVGIYLMLQGNLGVNPWDTLNLGLSQTFGITFGTASISLAILVLIVDILLKEKIGIGMLLDAVVVGKTVDLLDFINPIPKQSSIIWGSVLLLLGMIVCGFAEFVYMKCGLGCGPRDTLLVGFSRRFTNIPIGILCIGLFAVATLAGWLLGGPIGPGTLVTTVCQGLILETVFKILHFKPESIKHQSIKETAKIIFTKGK